MSQPTKTDTIKQLIDGINKVDAFDRASGITWNTLESMRKTEERILVAAMTLHIGRMYVDEDIKMCKKRCMSGAMDYDFFYGSTLLGRVCFEFGGGYKGSAYGGYYPTILVKFEPNTEC